MAKNIVLRSKLEGAGKTKRGLKSVDSGLRNLAKSAMAAGAAYFTARGIISGFKAVIDAAGKQEMAEKKLEAALGKTSKTLLNYASSLQEVSMFGDEATIEAMSMMAAFTKDEEALKKLTEATLDYAAATGTDLNAAAQLVGRTFGTSMNAMSRYGVAVEGAAGSTERLESLTGNLAKMFGGQAKAQADTMAGSLQQMGNAVGDLAEKMGERLAPFVILFANSVKNATVLLSKFMGDEEETTITIDDQIETIKKQIEAYKAMGNETKAMDANLIFFLPKLSEQEILMNKGAGAVNNFTQNLKDQIPKLELHLQMLEQMKEGYEGLDINIFHTSILWGELNEVIEQTGKWSDEIIIPLGDKLHVLALMSQQAFGMIASNLATISQAPGWEKMEKVAKRAAQVQALVDAYASANAAFKAMAGIPVVGPALGSIAAATALAAGLANVKMIESAATGFDGIVNKPTMFMTGEAGAERVSVTPLEGPNINGPQGGNIHLHFGAVTNEDYVKDFIVPEIQKAQRLNLA